jgi:hypothetical protein
LVSSPLMSLKCRRLQDASHLTGRALEDFRLILYCRRKEMKHVRSDFAAAGEPGFGRLRPRPGAGGLAPGAGIDGGGSAGAAERAGLWVGYGVADWPLQLCLVVQGVVELGDDGVEPRQECSCPVMGG